MKKPSIILVLFFISCQQSYAVNVVAHFEKMEKGYEKELKRVCKGKKIDDMSDREAIRCLTAYVKLLETRVQVNYEYYVNTLSLLNNMFYEGEFKNSRQ